MPGVWGDINDPLRIWMDNTWLDECCDSQVAAQVVNFRCERGLFTLTRRPGEENVDFDSVLVSLTVTVGPAAYLSL